jgi:hypothetical protein
MHASTATKKIRKSFFFQFSRRTAVIFIQLTNQSCVLEFRCESSPNPKSVSVKKSKNRTPHHHTRSLCHHCPCLRCFHTAALHAHKSEINIIHIVGVRSNTFQFSRSFLKEKNKEDVNRKQEKLSSSCTCHS